MPHADELPNFPIVLAAIGESEHTQFVAETAVRLAATLPSASLHLVHVIDLIPGTEHVVKSESAKSPAVLELREKAQARLDDFTAQAQQTIGRPVHAHLEFGDPGTRIIEVAARVHADYVVVGPVDSSSWHRVVFGSVADEVLRKAPCSVVLARPRRTTTA